MEQRIRDQPADGVDRLQRGFLMGAVFALCGGASWLLISVVPYDRPSALEVVLWGLMSAMLVAGYIAGLAAAIHRPTRRLGFGILIGLTLTFPAVVILTTGVLMAIFCCQ